MPNRKMTNAMTSTRMAWTKRERRKLIASLERHQERHEIDVLLCCQRLAEHRRHDAFGIARDRAGSGRIEDLLHDVVGRLDLGDLREVGTDRRGADLAGLVAGDAAALTLEDRLARLRVAGNLYLGRGASARSGGARRLGNVVELDVRRAAERLEKRGERPELGAVQPDRRFVHVRHDVRVALDEIRAGLQQRLDDVLLGAHARLGLRGAGADAREIRRAGPLLADPVADLARALRLEDLLAGFHELLGSDVAALERELGRRLGLDLRDRVRVVRVRTHHDQRERADLDADRDAHAQDFRPDIRVGSASLPPAKTGMAAWPCPPSLPFSPRPPSQKTNMTSAKKTIVTAVIMLAA